jgi:hypothetical protein
VKPASSLQRDLTRGLVPANARPCFVRWFFDPFLPNALV